MDRFSPYEYLAYLLPGGIVLWAGWIGLSGWPPPDSGSTGLVILVAAAFLIGHAVAAIASPLEPLFWGHLPGTQRDPGYGLFGVNRRYSDEDREALLGELRDRFAVPSADFPTAYRLAYTALQQSGLDSHLQILNQHIGLYRNATVASGLAFVIHATLLFAGLANLPVWWLAIYGSGLALFALRYRHFHVEFGDNVFRGVRVLNSRAEH